MGAVDRDAGRVQPEMINGLVQPQVKCDRPGKRIARGIERQIERNVARLYIMVEAQRRRSRSGRRYRGGTENSGEKTIHHNALLLAGLQSSGYFAERTRLVRI